MLELVDSLGRRTQVSGLTHLFDAPCGIQGRRSAEKNHSSLEPMGCITDFRRVAACKCIPHFFQQLIRLVEQALDYVQEHVVSFVTLLYGRIKAEHFHGGMGRKRSLQIRFLGRLRDLLGGISLGFMTELLDQSN